MMHRITVKEVEYMAFRIAREAQEMQIFKEPIPDFSTRFPNILESCLAVPFQSFGGVTPYKTLTSKAGILFYLMNKNHPFQNGNKRIAMTSLLVFLHENKKWIKVDVEEFYNFSMFVAESKPMFKEETVNMIKKFLKEYIIDLEE